MIVGLGWLRSKLWSFLPSILSNRLLAFSLDGSLRAYDYHIDETNIIYYATMKVNVT